MTTDNASGVLVSRILSKDGHPPDKHGVSNADRGNSLSSNVLATRPGRRGAPFPSYRVGVVALTAVARSRPRR